MGILWDILNEIDDRTHTCDPVNDEPYMYVDDEKEIISKHMTDNTDGNLSEIGSTLNKIEAEHPYKVPGDYDTYSQYNEGWCDAIDRVRGELENLNNRWVPTDKRLPEEEAKEFIKKELDGVGYLYPCLLTYISPLTERIHVVRFFFDIYEHWFVNAGEELCEKKRCIAWQPLPDPYITERSNGHDREEIMEEMKE